MVHPDNGILFSAKKNCAIKPQKYTMRSLKCILLRGRSNLNGYILYDSNNMTYEKSKTMKIIKILVVARGWGRDKHADHRGVFRAVKLFCKIL